ncbi:TIM barrel protein [Lichenihabitans sp. Uapishka_5]|uniref:sugar phosphate isomerase/epimerase family protein n=1 Tax=Lichenihabitans sp. Uapishka_5 TaxID=3037302 RepID=UPI0029E80757|nr:TIM barrel protein [Lichenihabitans sp. Uapishka_5]MDX7950692.1 TIM barrel protein [Lichenihabitans sp. Uapishka_5]
MSFTLSLSTNPFVNRYAEPEDLIRTLGQEVGIGHIQLTHEFINPSWDKGTIARLTARMAKVCAAEGVQVTSLMTGPYGRLNHFGHPDPEVRRYYVEWFKTLADIAADLGCPAVGTQYAILTFKDWDDADRRTKMTGIALDCWRAVAEHAGRRGLAYLFWEPMSVGREYGHTIAETHRLQDWIETHDLPIPLKPMVDIDHGDVSSPDPADVDPFAWAEHFATRSPIIHIKQSSMNKGGHWPFTAAYNKDGRIQPETLIAAVRAGGGTDNELCLELAFREREPADRTVVAAMRESVEFWSAHARTGRMEAAQA